MRPQVLNLLVIFDHIMTERSITRAAERLAMTQPAVSNAVSRMRTIWKDELFVKDGRNIQPTSYAKDLWALVRDPLYQIEQAISPEVFEPQTAQRTFRVALTDLAVDSVWLSMRLFFQRHAPGINLYAIPYTIGKSQQLLDDAEVDLVFSARPAPPSNIFSSHLADIDYVCVMRIGHPLAGKTLTVDAFAQAEHLLVTLSGDSSGPTDEALSQLGLTRRVAMTVNNFSSAIPVILQSDLIAILPIETIDPQVADQQLWITKPPIHVADTVLSIWWHKRQDKDAGLTWFRENIVTVFLNNRDARRQAVLKVMN